MDEEQFKHLQETGSVEFVDPKAERKRDSRNYQISAIVGLALGVWGAISTDSWVMFIIITVMGFALCFGVLD